MAGTLGVTTTNEEQYKQVTASLAWTQKEITIASGAGVVERGTVLGLITATNLYTPYDPDDTIGGEITARAIAVDTVDATAANVKCQGYFTGLYRYEDLVWAIEADDTERNAALLALQDRGIIINRDFIA